METDQQMHLIYLVLLGIFVGSYFFFDAGAKFGQNLKMALVWFGIFAGVSLGYKFFSDQNPRDLVEASRPKVSSFVDREVELRRARDGHFYVTLDVNGTPVRFVVDTGASLVVLSQEDAARAGMNSADLHFTRRASTANGEVQIAPVTLEEVVLGGYIDSGVRAAVNGGVLDTSLLGMSYLRRFQKIEIEGDKLTLVR